MESKVICKIPSFADNFRLRQKFGQFKLILNWNCVFLILSSKKYIKKLKFKEELELNNYTEQGKQEIEMQISVFVPL